MPDKIYNWKRFWVQRTEDQITSPILDYDGYLLDPDTSNFFAPFLLSFEAITKTRCLVLLGEPGIGKSQAINAEQKDIVSKVEKEGDKVLPLDLRSYGSEDRLIKDLFMNPIFTSWTSGQHILHVFLDSLDECLLRVDNIASILLDELKKHPKERLYLRIACRSFEWPKILEDGLKELWGSDIAKVYELAPLRRKDVAEAAKANGIDQDAFINAIAVKEIVPLAIKPITLKFLLNTYLKEDQFPSTQTDLYSKGCQLLCEEVNDSRIAARRVGKLPSKSRMLIAARIAAISVFANRFAVWTGIDQGDVPEEDLVIQDLYGSIGINGTDQVEVNHETVIETLDKGLFISRGLNRMGWAHQTYAEFLAANYLVKNNVAVKQIMSLITHPYDPDKKIVPQLHETAAWIAGMAPDVFQEIMKLDPEVLLKSDVAATDVKDRVSLVDSLLKLYDEAKSIPDSNMGLQYRKFMHPTLTEQIRPYISDSTKGYYGRLTAIAIAEACELKLLQDELASVALESSQPFMLRFKAVRALDRIGNDETRKRLKPLIASPIEEDPAFDLRGSVLQALWPNHLTAEELFNALTEPSEEVHFGVYDEFVSNKIASYLCPSDLPIALEWVRTQGNKSDLPSSFGKLVHQVMERAWENLNSSGVLESFTKILLSQLNAGHSYSVEDYLDRDEEKRRQVLATILPTLASKKGLWRSYIDGHLAQLRDLQWMIAQIRISQPEEIQKVLADWISTAFSSENTLDPALIDAIINACQNNSILKQQFNWLLNPVDISSIEAEKMKSFYQKSLEPRVKPPPKPQIDPPPEKRIARLLDLCESGNSAAWWQLTMKLLLKPDSRYYENELEPDITTLPGWSSADAITRKRLLTAAIKYVQEGKAEPSEWLGKNCDHRPSIAGYKALRLILNEEPNVIDTIGTEVWKNWAPIIIDYPRSNETLLLEIAYKIVPEIIIETILFLIDRKNYINPNVDAIWDDRIAQALLSKVKENGLHITCLKSILFYLLKYKVKEAREFAESLIPLSISSDSNERDKAIAAARSLLFHENDAGWEVVWPAIQQDNEFGKEVIPAVANIHNKPKVSITARLKDDQLANLYVWLARNYSYEQDTKYYFGGAEGVRVLRDSILTQLINRGTYQACDLLQQIASELPNLNFTTTLFSAKANARHKTWIPPQPVDIFKISSDKENRLIRSGGELLDVIIESLERLQVKLQGKTPAVIDLWDKIGDKKYRPIDENSLSNYVKRHFDEDLKQRGIIANREVQIRSGEGVGKGEVTDIHIDAVIPTGKKYEPATIIIEVKGNWHKELYKAMETQLVGRYMKDNSCQYGLYLVGWYNCNQWDSNDSRKGKARKIDIPRAQKKFDEQATSLSQQGKIIKAFVLNTALR